MVASSGQGSSWSCVSAGLLSSASGGCEVAEVEAVDVGEEAGVFDAVDAAAGGLGDAGGTVGVGGDAQSDAVGVVDDAGEGGVVEHAGGRVGAGVRHRAGGDDLDDAGAGGDVAVDEGAGGGEVGRTAAEDGVGPVGGGDLVGGGDDVGSRDDALGDVAHEPVERFAGGAQVADGGDPTGEKVGAGGDTDLVHRVGVVVEDVLDEGVGPAEREVQVGVDQTGQQSRVAEVEDGGACGHGSR